MISLQITTEYLNFPRTSSSFSLKSSYILSRWAVNCLSTHAHPLQNTFQPPPDLLHRGWRRVCPASRGRRSGCAARGCWRERERSLFSPSQRPAAAASVSPAGGPSRSQPRPGRGSGEDAQVRLDLMNKGTEVYLWSF